MTIFQRYFESFLMKPCKHHQIGLHTLNYSKSIVISSVMILILMTSSIAFSSYKIGGALLSASEICFTCIFDLLCSQSACLLILLPSAAIPYQLRMYQLLLLRLYIRNLLLRVCLLALLWKSSRMLPS